MQLSFFSHHNNNQENLSISQFHSEVANFNEFNKVTDVLEFPSSEISIPIYVNEFWTSKQRAAHSLHEISYRACFKPQLPRFFIKRLTKEDDIVYDPFSGRGTTVIEAALLNRVPIGCDINPLSSLLTYPRLNPPQLSDIKERLDSLNLDNSQDTWEELLVFFHKDTLLQITNLRNYILEKENNGDIDYVDAWIRMVATNRLTGHSKGFFSGYTLPPNQAVSIESQRRINNERNQSPPFKNIKELIVKKSTALLAKLQKSEMETLKKMANSAVLLTESCDNTPKIKNNSVKLVVTSPPFLDVIDYQKDNWLRCWFNGIDPKKVYVWQIKNQDDWVNKMETVFKELLRVLKPGGFISFEVGEVKKGKVLLETLVIPVSLKVGLLPELVLVNSQTFTKTSNCWGVNNQKKGTNTNRIILLRKPE